MRWNKTDIKRISLSITNYCNAACPQCMRTNPLGLNKADWLPLVQWDFDTFKKAFPKKTLNKLDEIQFCGTWGDPLMLKDLYMMCDYIINESQCNIEITTNGSIREEKDYWELGVLCHERLRMWFDIDGIDQKMHSHYRRGTKLKQVLNNMKTLSYTRSIPQAQTIIFKHNENYVKEIEKLAMDYGALIWRGIKSDRFSSDSNTFNFIDEIGNNQILEKCQSA